MQVELPWLAMLALLSLPAAAFVWVRTRKPSAVLFLLAAGLFLFAGSAPSLGSTDRAVRHAVVLDVSDSMRARLPRVGRWLDERASRALPAGHELAWYEVSDALRPRGDPTGSATRLRTLAALAADGSFNGEVVLLTDGRAPAADVLGAIDPSRLILLRAPADPRPDASVVALRGPTHVPEGGMGLLQGTIQADQDVRAEYTFWRDDVVLEQGQRDLRAGLAAGVTHRFAAGASGLARFRLTVRVAEDREVRNDSATLAVFTGAAREILYVSDPRVPEAADSLLQRLRADSANRVTSVAALPANAAQLEGVGLLVINNQPLHATGLAPAQTDVIADWVNGGGSLLMAGSTGAFGPGGYRNTPIEEVMPVRFRPDDQPPRHVLLLLDASSSMAEPLPGGRTRMDAIREAAQVALASLGPSDLAATTAFSERLRRAPEFMAPLSAAQRDQLSAINPGGSTRILDALAGGLDALLSAQGESKEGRILLLTDGEDTSGAAAGDWQSFADRLRVSGVALDIVLTSPQRGEWVDWLGDRARVWQVESDIAGLIDTMQQALAGIDEEFVLRKPLEVGGVVGGIGLVVRTSLRRDRGVVPLLNAQTPVTRVPEYPLLAMRQLTGRTAVICTDTWGDEAHVRFLSNEFWSAELQRLLDWLLEYANRNQLVLNPVVEEFELVWTGTTEAPDADLKAGDLAATRAGTGRWRLERLPPGDVLPVWHGQRLLQRIPLPRTAGPELTLTGDDEAFFATCEAAGARVFSSLDAWEPRRAGEADESTTDLRWLPALLACLLLIAGFAFRRR